MQKTSFDFAVTITLLFTIIISTVLPALAYDKQLVFANGQIMANNQINNNSNSANDSDGNTSPKVVILNFYDDEKDQFINAKPILDKYGFKGTFFIVCSWTNSNNTDRMSWHDISQLYREGQDIESHSMTHKVLNKLSPAALDYEIGQSKQCIHDHIGVYPTVFSAPHNKGWNNETVINTISKYYDLSIGGFITGPMFLHCYGWKTDQLTPQMQQQRLSPSNQTDCRTYSDNGTLDFANRYDIKERTHNALDTRYSHNDTQIFDKFVQLVNSQISYNKNGIIDAVPIIGYHDIDNNKTITSTDVDLFDSEMKYLRDNGFKVLTMSDLGYDEKTNYLYIKRF
jgi:peptidoglycan/xylan/chitin deacetylase (PgdA/CDA1 family)